MKGNEVKFYWIDVRTQTEYDEDIVVPFDQDPEKYLRNLLSEFNEEEDRRHKQDESYKPAFRTFARLGGETGKKGDVFKRCNFSHKVNQITISRGHESYDILQCVDCKFLIRRFNLEPPWSLCDPDKTCLKCNKKFKTARNLELHNKRGSHRLPDWYPDGI